MSKEWKERIEKVVIGLVLLGSGVFFTALLKGDELKGLSKITVFFHILNAGVPLWVFLIILFVAILGSVRWVKSRQKQLLFVEWKNLISMWTIANAGDELWMQVSLHGFITNSDKVNALIITSVYLEGTKPTMSLHETITLPPEHVCDEDVTTMVKPVLLKEGETFKGNVIFVDQLQRRHKVPIELKGYAPQPQSQSKPDAAKSAT